MNQSKAFITSLLFAGLAMFLVFLYVEDQKKRITDDFGNEVTVVVAARNINEFEPINPKSMLKQITVPKKFAQPGSFSDPQAFDGTVASAPIQEGEQILSTKVLAKGRETGLASQVAVTYRAVSIPISDNTGVSRLVKPGDRIDLVASISYQVGDRTESEIKTLMQNVHVLAAGELIQNQIPSVFVTDPVTGTARAENMRGNRSFSTITVEVAPQDAQKLIFVMESGATLYMTLRNPVDRMIATMSNVSVDDVLGEGSRKATLEAARRPAAQTTQRPAQTPRPAPPPPSPWLQQGGGLAK